jgi:hypothetical protein
MIAVAEHGRRWAASILVLLFVYPGAHAQAPSAAMTVLAASVEKSQSPGASPQREVLSLGERYRLARKLPGLR